MIVTKKKVSLRLKGGAYRAGVQSVMMYGSETWAVKAEDEQRLVQAENRMMRWMCGVTLSDRCSQNAMLGKLGIRSIIEIMRCNRLRWFSHLERKNVDDWVSKCRNIEVEGRPRKMWQE